MTPCTQAPHGNKRMQGLRREESPGRGPGGDPALNLQRKRPRFSKRLALERGAQPVSRGTRPVSRGMQRQLVTPFCATTQALWWPSLRR